MEIIFHDQLNGVMKLFKHLAAAFVALSLLSSCSVLQSVASSAVSTGKNTGTAIMNIYNVLKSTGAIDLSNLTNLINIGQILTGAGTLTDATSSYLEQFASGLIKGSSNLINDSNVSSVINSLKSLANVDTTSLMNAATAAASGTLTKLSNSTTGVSETLSSLNSIYQLLK